MENGSQDIISRLLSDKGTTEALTKIIGQLTAGEEAEAQNSSLDASGGKASAPQSEKQLSLQRKIDVLTALKPLFGSEYSKKADTVINILSIAKILMGIRQ